MTKHREEITENHLLHGAAKDPKTASQQGVEIRRVLDLLCFCLLWLFSVPSVTPWFNLHE